MPLTETQKLSKVVINKTIETSKTNLKVLLNVVRSNPEKYNHHLHTALIELEKLEKLTRSMLHQLLGVRFIKLAGVPEIIDLGVGYSTSIEDLDDSIEKMEDLLASMVNALLEMRYVISAARSKTPGYKNLPMQVSIDWEAFQQHTRAMELKKSSLVDKLPKVGG